MNSKINGYKLKSFPYNRKSRANSLSESGKTVAHEQNFRSREARLVMRRTIRGENVAPEATFVIAARSRI